MSDLKEIWKDIPNYKGLYKVSNLGNVKSLGKTVKYNDGRVYNYKNKILKPCVSNTGYYIVGLTANKKVKSFNVHKLVAMAFLNHNPCNYEKVVDHIDNNPRNNNLNNIQLVTHRFNSSKDKKNKSSKYTGVRWKTDRQKWYATIQINKKEKHLGCFKSEYKAHLAYKKELNQINK